VRGARGDQHRDVRPEALARLPRILALSKADLVPDAEAQSAAAAWRERLGPDVAVLVTSSATHGGIEALETELLRRVPLADPAPIAELAAQESLAEHRVFRPAAKRAWRVETLGEGAWRVSGEPVERLMARYDLENEEALLHVERRLKRMGVIQALEDAGFEPGDDVEIAGVVFELDPA
jgi:GTP-binding protein